MSNLDSALKSIRESYKKTLPDKLRQLTELWQQRRVDDLKNAAHRLKGSGKSYGYPEITDICSRLEFAAELGDWAGISQAIKELEQIIETQ